MYLKYFATITGLLLILTSCAHAVNLYSQTFGPTPTGNTLYVGGSGPGNYTTIQTAINDANPDDTVFVFNGTYHEHVAVNKRISLVGESRINTKIHGGNGNGVSISSDYSRINNFSISVNYGMYHNGIGCSADYVTISNCTIWNTWKGITFQSGGDHNIVYNCESFNNNIGIYFWSSNNNRVTDCYIHDNTRGSGTGIYIDIDVCYGNEIYHNNFLDNDNNVHDTRSNIWDNGYPSGGNFYDDYKGLDNYHGVNQDIPGPDGIGDTPYNISGGNNKDLYPLSYQWGENPPVANITYLVNDKNVTFNASLSYDRDGIIISYYWEFGDGNNGTGSIVTHAYAYYGTYVVTLSVTDDDGKNDTISSDVIVDSIPPEISNVQVIPSVQNIGGYVNISAAVTDNIEVNKVYLYIDYPDGIIENFSITQNKTGDTYYSNKTYYPPGIYTYNVWAIDTYGNNNVSADYNFEIINQPPYIPSNPFPENNATNSSIFIILSWTGGDPDPDDTVTFEVYFGTTNPPPLVIISQSGTTYDPGTLNLNTTYYWKIVAMDSHGATTPGPVWHFTTEPTVPDLNCSGSLSWTQVPAGSTQTGSFILENIGDPASDLDWEISEWPSWGTWTFSPDSGTGLKPEAGPLTINIEVIAPNQQEEQFIGAIKVVNTDNPSDYEIIPVTLSTPHPDITFRSHILTFIQRLIERFPSLQQLIFNIIIFIT